MKRLDIETIRLVFCPKENSEAEIGVCQLRCSYYKGMNNTNREGYYIWCDYE